MKAKTEQEYQSKLAKLSSNESEKKYVSQENQQKLQEEKKHLEEEQMKVIAHKEKVLEKEFQVKLSDM